jgi:hypothetical protein
MPAAELRDALVRAALAEIPKILTLQDRVPVSATYGCFHRAYWHYCAMDFPSGMTQELVLPLALAWSLDLPDNPYRGAPAIRDAAEAGIRYAARSAHRDGSCDDYYPFERAVGAAGFSLYACLEVAHILGLEGDAEIDAFVQRRAQWLADHRESGQLSNHEALIVACLARMAERFGEGWEAPLCQRVARLLSWQSGEGWFSEYGGADPGYLTLTIGLLAETERRRPDLGLREPCRRAIDFLAAMIHPDGTLGGGYTSRATLNYFPHGLEIAGAWHPPALAINGLGLRALAEGRSGCFSDDTLVGHHVWSWLMARREWQAERPATLEPESGRHEFPEAHLLVDGRESMRLHLGWTRGGAFQLYEGAQLLCADTGPTLRLDDGRVAVTHLEGIAGSTIEADRITVWGHMAWAKSQLLTPAKSIILRTLMLTVGRFFPDLVRRLLQGLLVTGRKDAPFRYRRTLEWRDGAWEVEDEIVAEQGWAGVRQAGIAPYQTSVTNVMARVWSAMQLQPWLDWSDRLAGLGARDRLVVRRRLARDGG